MNLRIPSLKRSLRLLLLPVVLLLGTQCLAQSTIDVVELKNGSVIRGTIVEQVVGESIKIKTRDGSLWVYRLDEVVRISKEAITLPGSPPADMDDYGGLLGLGVSVGSGGIPGIHLRCAPHPNIALEAGMSWLPMVIYTPDRRDDGSGLSYPYHQYRYERRFAVLPVISGGADIFFGQKYKSRSKKIVRNGLLFRGGASLHKDADQSMVAMGWARERFREGRSAPSYCFGLGLGAWLYSDPNENPFTDLSGYYTSVLPMIHFKFHWNWYVVKKQKK